MTQSRLLRRTILRPLRWLRGRMRLRRSYRIPLEGYLFIAITLMIGLAAMNTAAQLLYLVFGVLCAFWVLSDIVASTGMGGLRVRRIAPNMVSAGQPVRIEVELTNTKRLLASFSLQVIDYSGRRRPIGATFFSKIEPKSTQREGYTVLFPRRGRHQLEGIALATRFPFGLIQRSFYRAEPWEIIVMPPVLPVERMLQRARVDLGEFESRQKGAGSSLHSIRAYTAGESARDIHWRVSARTGNLVVREYESEERRRASIILDNRLPETSEQALDALEKAVVLASSVVTYLCERGHQVELLTASGEISFGTGAGHAVRCRRALAMIEAEPIQKADPATRAISSDSLRVEIPAVGRDPSPGAHMLRIGDFNEELAAALAPRDIKVEDIEGLEHSIWAIGEARTR